MTSVAKGEADHNNAEGNDRLFSVAKHYAYHNENAIMSDDL